VRALRYMSRSLVIKEGCYKKTQWDWFISFDLSLMEAGRLMSKGVVVVERISFGRSQSAAY